jgi:hypothetical protein
VRNVVAVVEDDRLVKPFRPAFTRHRAQTPSAITAAPSRLDGLHSGQAMQVATSRCTTIFKKAV